MATNRKFWLVAMTNGYQLENFVDKHTFLGHICLIEWALVGLNGKVWHQIGFDEQENPVGSCYSWLPTRIFCW